MKISTNRLKIQFGADCGMLWVECGLTNELLWKVLGIADFIEQIGSFVQHELTPFLFRFYEIKSTNSLQFMTLCIRFLKKEI